MLAFSYNYRDILEKLFVSTWRDPKYKYFYYGGFEHIPNEIVNAAPNNCWDKSYVSLNKDGEVIGYISYRLDRFSSIAKDLSILSFRSDSESTLIFTEDLMQAITDFFELYGGDSIHFSGITKNPATVHYSSIVRRLGGKQVGIDERAIRLSDGKFYDLMHFRILKEEYFSWKANK